MTLIITRQYTDGSREIWADMKAGGTECGSVGFSNMQKIKETDLFYFVASGNTCEDSMLWLASDLIKNKQLKYKKYFDFERPFKDPVILQAALFEACQITNFSGSMEEEDFLNIKGYILPKQDNKIYYFWITDMPKVVVAIDNEPIGYEGSGQTMAKALVLAGVDIEKVFPIVAQVEAGVGPSYTYLKL